MNKEERRLAKWEKIKSKGLISYLIKKGLFYHGLSFFLIWVFLVPFINSNFTSDFIKNENFKERVSAFVVVSILYGLCLGYISWRNLEKRYAHII